MASISFSDSEFVGEGDAGNTCEPYDCGDKDAVFQTFSRYCPCHQGDQNYVHRGYETLFAGCSVLKTDSLQRIAYEHIYTAQSTAY